MSAVRSHVARYAAEADMLPPIVDAVDLVVAGLPDGDDRTILFEVPAFESIPDVVIVQIDRAAVERRQNAEVTPVADVTSVRALLALNAGVVDLNGLVRQTAVSRAHLRRSVLPALADAGWVILTDVTGGVELRVRYEPVLNWVVTIEAKRAKWREAVAQARRQKRVADRSFIALDAASANPARSWSADLSREGIGLVTVDANTHVATLERRPRRGPKPDVAARHLFGERVLEMAEAGTRVGRTFPVFGQVHPMRVCVG